jgi:transposase
MAGFVEGVDRGQSMLFPARLDEYVAEDNPVRVVDLFVDDLDLGKLGFGDVQPLATGRPGYRPATMLKIYIKRVQRLEATVGMTGEITVLPSG